MMKQVLRFMSFALLCLCAVQVALPARAGTRMGASAGEGASILPVSTFSIGNSLSSGSNGATFGYGLVANGITDYWATGSANTIDFVIFVFPGRQSATQNITFTVSSP